MSKQKKIVYDNPFQKIQGKKTLFITTKNIDYIRNVQEVNLIKACTGDYKLVFSKKKHYIGRLLEIYLWLLVHSLKKYDIVIIGFSPQLILPFFSWKIKGTVYVDFFISVYDTFVNDRKKFRRSGIGSRICRFLDKSTIKRGDFFIVDTYQHCKYFQREFGMPMEHTSVLYLLADSRIYYPRTIVKQGDYIDKYVVLYFGSILPLQGVDVILGSLRFLQCEKDLLIEIIGPVKHKVEYNNVKYIEWLPQKELAEHIAMADLCLAGHFNPYIEKAKRTIPGKAYIYEAMHKPMILGDNPANRELFDEDEYHYYVEMGNSSKLADKIICIKEIEMH